MEINTSNPVNTQVEGLTNTQKNEGIRPEQEREASQQGVQTEEDNPDYRVNLSDMAKNNIAGVTYPKEDNQYAAGDDLNDQEAAELAEQTAAQLSQTNVPIANQAVQKAVDLFS